MRTLLFSIPFSVIFAYCSAPHYANYGGGPVNPQGPGTGQYGNQNRQYYENTDQGNQDYYDNSQDNGTGMVVEPGSLPVYDFYHDPYMDEDPDWMTFDNSADLDDNWNSDYSGDQTEDQGFTGNSETGVADQLARTVLTQAPDELKDKFNVSQIKLVYDSLGRLVRSEYLDELKQVINGKDGAAVVEYVYDKFGNLIEKKLFDKEHLPVDLENVPAVIKQVFDENQNLKSLLYLDKGGNPLKDLSKIDINYKDGKAVEKLVYDGLGNLIKKEQP